MTVDEVREALTANFNITSEKIEVLPSGLKWHLFYVTDNVFYAHCVREYGAFFRERFAYQMELAKVHEAHEWGEILYGMNNHRLVTSCWARAYTTFEDMPEITDYAYDVMAKAEAA